jgi:hypothetical protein
VPVIENKAQLVTTAHKIRDLLSELKGDCDVKVADCTSVTDDEVRPQMNLTMSWGNNDEYQLFVRVAPENGHSKISILGANVFNSPIRVMNLNGEDNWLNKLAEDGIEPILKDPLNCKIEEPEI